MKKTFSARVRPAVFLVAVLAAIPVVLALVYAPALAQVLPDSSLVYQCPMDPDIRSNVPGVCPRCGMTLRAGIP